MDEAQAAEHRRMAGILFNAAWAGLEADARSTADETAMLAAAWGSWFHWRQVGTPREFAISDWQVGRVYAALGDADRAERHAEASRRWCAEHNLGAFLEAYAHEGLARAALVAGDAGTTRRHIAAATARMGRIVDPSERALIDADLADLEARL